MSRENDLASEVDRLIESNLKSQENIRRLQKVLQDNEPHRVVCRWMQHSLVRTGNFLGETIVLMRDATFRDVEGHGKLIMLSIYALIVIVALTYFFGDRVMDALALLVSAVGGCNG